MSNVRLYHLAHEWDVSAQSVLEALQEAGRRLKSHYIEVEPDEIPEIKEILYDAGVFAGEPEPGDEEGEGLSSAAEAALGLAEHGAAPDSEAPEVGDAADESLPSEGGSSEASEPPPAEPDGSWAEEAPGPAPGGPGGPRPDADAERRAPEVAGAPAKGGGGKGSPKGKGGAPEAPAGVAKGFQGFAPGFDPNQTRRRREGGRPTRPGAGGAPFPPPAELPAGESGKDDGRRKRGGSRTAVSPTKRSGGRPATRRSGGQAQMGRGRRLERLMQEREHWYKASRTRGRKRGSQSAAHVVRPKEAEIQQPISLKDLSAALAIRVTELTRFFMKNGLMITQNQPVPKEALELVGAEYGIDITVKAEEDVEAPLQDIVEAEPAADEDLEPRQPVIAVLGHVDHGKTSLLDKVRSAKSPVAGSEAGGITQHIGAYVAQHDGKPVTFIDTPGHEAFTEMRVRGANATDLVLLVIAADDGVMPQTKEAIQHAQAAGSQILVALNKIDKPNADPDKVKQQLAGIEGMLPRDFGGETDIVEVSAITGDGIDDLMELILLESEALELRANPKQAAWGAVLEASKTTGRGIVATFLVQDGTVEKGDTVIAGRASGRVRRMLDDTGRVVRSAGPGVPVEVLGLDDVPEAGERFYKLEKGQADVKAIINKREEEQRKAALDTSHIPTDVGSLWEEFERRSVKEVRVILKTDAQGNLQVLKREIDNLATDEVRCKIIRDGVGGITTADINLALAETSGNVVVVGFGVVPDGKARRLAKEHGIEIRTHKVIYELLGEVKEVMAGALEPELHENVLGQVEVRRVFKSSKLGNICGCFVEEGLVRRNAQARLIRDGIVLWEGDLASLRRFKDDVQEVRENFECGIKLKGYDDVKEGDRLEIFEIQKIPRTLD